MSKSLVALVRWLVALAMPVFIVLLLVWLVWQPWFVRWEYGKPNFPPDRYGFTAEQRLDLTLDWIEYYHSSVSPEEGLRAIEESRLAGTGQPLYQHEEIVHMIDVRLLLDTLWRVVLPISALIVVGGLAALLIARRTRRDGYAALFMGGVVTTGLLLFFILYVLFSFDTFFVTLHNVFFPPGTWTFDYSSTLIRLFPEQLWFDGALLLVSSALVAGLLVLLIGYLLGRRSRLQT